ncbi:MAG TPA: YceI family protein [Gemmatimonadaceae bacterium]|nr:YceI family protein [Gemmatimonadaceae bacterium]
MQVMTSLLLALLLLRSSIPAASPGWPVDRAHSRVTFTVTKWGFVEVEGRFHDFAGTIAFDQQHPARSRVDWRVRIDSIETGEPNRDKAVQGPEYFDAARFPEIHFSSQRVTPLGNGRFDVQGQMTIRGKTRPLTIQATYGGTHSVSKEGTYAIFQTEFTIDRYDYGVVGGSVLGPAISREVRVKLIAAARS